MKKFLLLMPLLALLASSCIPEYTRDEVDTFKVIQQDTTYTYFVKNAPGNRDRGIVSPSTKVIESKRFIEEKDSSEKRTYPDFIRLALFETSGIIGGSSENSTGLGLFGIHPNLGELGPTYKGKSGNFFTGGIYRVGIVENRLRPFKYDNNWTWGSTAFELIVPDAKADNMLMSVAPLFIKKRIFLREEIPYVAVSFSGGFGWMPSLYGNLTASIDVGSIGGLNIKSMVGYTAGVTRWTDGNSVSFPYFGFGISMLDFLNLEKETYIEMKDMLHSAWNIGILKVDLLNTGAKKSLTNTDPDAVEDKILIKGFSAHVINADLALPFANNRFFAGTSLLSLLATGKNEWGMAVLPLRFGYNHTLADYGLMLTPSVESGYFPSSYMNANVKLTFRANEKFNFSLVLGYVSGNSNVKDLLGGSLNDQFGSLGEFSNYYIGFSVGVWDRIFTPEELRYNQTSPIKE